MMKSSTLRSTSSWRRVFGAQFRSVGITIRPAATAAGVVMIIVTLLAGYIFFGESEGLAVRPDLAIAVALVAPLLAIAVWREEYYFQRSYLASLPVDETLHVLVKVAAGWIWLMAFAAVVMLWMMAVAVMSGGQIGVDELRVMATELSTDSPSDDIKTFTRRWTTPTWQWAAFFTGPTVTYLVGSALVLAGSRARRWLAGFAAVWAFLAFAEEQGILLLGAVGASDLAYDVVTGSRYGLETLTSGVAGPIAHITTAAGREVFVWSEPALGILAVSALLWTSLAVTSVLVALWCGRKG